MFLELEKDSAFIGLQKNGNDQWVWNDGSENTFDGWDDSQPADNGKCAVLRKDGKWNTEDCVTMQYYDCKYKASKFFCNHTIILLKIAINIIKCYFKIVLIISKFISRCLLWLPDWVEFTKRLVLFTPR